MAKRLAQVIVCFNFMFQSSVVILRSKVSMMPWRCVFAARNEEFSNQTLVLYFCWWTMLSLPGCVQWRIFLGWFWSRVQPVSTASAFLWITIKSDLILEWQANTLCSKRDCLQIFKLNAVIFMKNRKALHSNQPHWIQRSW